MDLAFKEAESRSQGGAASRAFGSSGSSSGLSNMTSLLGQVPGAGDLIRQAQDLQHKSDEQRQYLQNSASVRADIAFNANDAKASQNIPGTNIDPVKTVKQIYPILEFRDKVAKAISATIEKIPGLEALVEKITETLTLFVLSLLAPFIRPIIEAVSKQLKAGSGGVIDASGRSQYEPWTDPHCSDPTHSLLSKDHFSNILNEPAGQVASIILQYVAPRIIYAWEHPDVPVEQVLNDVIRIFHHPAARDHSCEAHRNMYSTVERWVWNRPDGGSNLHHLLSSDSVRHGKNHTVDTSKPQHHASIQNLPGMSHMPNLPHMPHMPQLPSGVSSFLGSGSQSKVAGSPWAQIGRMREMGGPEGSEAGAVNETPAAFAGTQIDYDSSRPPAGPEAGYSARSRPLGNPYGQPPYPSHGPQSSQSYGPEASRWQQYPGQGPPAEGYPRPTPQYGYDPTTPQKQGYSYQGAPPAPYYGAGPPPY